MSLRFLFINKITKKEGNLVQNWVINEHLKVTGDKNKQLQLFNSFFVDSVQCLGKNFGVRSTVLEPANVNFPVFAIKHVSDSAVTKALDSLKGSKSKDAFHIDVRFFKNYKLKLCKPSSSCRQSQQ